MNFLKQPSKNQLKAEVSFEFGFMTAREPSEKEMSAEETKSFLPTQDRKISSSRMQP